MNDGFNGCQTYSTVRCTRRADGCIQNNFGGAEGGAIHNRGDIVVDGVAEFSENIGGVSV